MPLLWFQNCEVMHGCSKNTFFELERSDIITTFTPYLGVASSHSLRNRLNKIRINFMIHVSWCDWQPLPLVMTHTHRFQVGSPTPGVAFAMGDFYIYRYLHSFIAPKIHIGQVTPGISPGFFTINDPEGS